MQIAAMLRVKNEGRWIGEVIDALKPICDPIIVMDDHSTDDTAYKCHQHGAKVRLSPFQGIDEARDKDWLLRKLEADCEPGTWVLCIDGDEILQSASIPKVLEAANGSADAFSFRVLYLWDSRNRIRIDGCYKNFSRPSMFRLKTGLTTFRRTGAHANLHCSSVPADYVNQCARADVNLLHLGYMDREDRIRKYRWYNEVDPANSAEDGYRHMVIGDLYPKDAAFRHGGPLEVVTI